jgi:hypothetical protein
MMFFRQGLSMGYKILFITAVLFLIPTVPVFSGEYPDKARDMVYVGNFSESGKTGAIPSGWEPLVFKNIDRKTDYAVVKHDGVTVLSAKSDAASSGLIRKIKIDPATYPIISWRWKITSTFDKGDVTRKDGDDYPARIYITFEYDPEKAGFFERTKFKTAKLLYGEYPPAAAINYIWSSKAPKETVVPNPYTKQAMMIVVQSGDAEKNTWKTEKRNILADYQKAFGTAPPMISGIAVMTDTDNTGDFTETFYGDIILRKNKRLTP